MTVTASPLETRVVAARAPRAITDLVDAPGVTYELGRPRARKVDPGRQGREERLPADPARGARAGALHVPLPAGGRAGGRPAAAAPADRGAEAAAGQGAGLGEAGPGRGPEGAGHRRREGLIAAEAAIAQANKYATTPCPQGARSSTARATSSSSCRRRFGTTLPGAVAKPGSIGDGRAGQDRRADVVEHVRLVESGPGRSILMLDRLTPASVRAARSSALIANTRGSTFSMCERGLRGEPGYAKYPRLPVLRCAGFTSGGDPASPAPRDGGSRGA